MRLTEEQIAKYQKIYFETFGEHLPKEIALTQSMALARLVKRLAEKLDVNSGSTR